MHYTAKMLLACAPFLYSGSYERAAQLVLLGIAIDSSRPSPMLHRILLSPLVVFAMFAVVFEIVHFIFRRKYKSARETWNHIQKLKGQCDLEAYLQLMLSEQKTLWMLRDWEAKIYGECTHASEKAGSPRA